MAGTKDLAASVDGSGSLKETRREGRDGSLRIREEVHREEDLALAAGFGDLSLHRDVEGGGFALSESTGGDGAGYRGDPGGLVGGAGGSRQGPLAVGFGLSATVRMWREFGSKALEKAMCAAWSPLGKMEMTIVEENFFLFRFVHRPDVNKVLREGPWRFNDHPIAIMKKRTANDMEISTDEERETFSQV